MIKMINKLEADQETMMGIISAFNYNFITLSPAINDLNDRLRVLEGTSKTPNLTVVTKH